ncbi:MAG: GTP 3',8-cyclase MoaA [Oliverpabstia sp.]
MKDTYGRTIDYMRISITDRCNLRCRYCMPNGIQTLPMEKILTYEEIELICRAAAEVGIRKLKITGGEPLVRLGCPELIGKLKRIPGIEQVTMTTNGILLGRYLPELLENGLDAVNISLDTFHSDTYKTITGKDELKKVLRSIDQCVEAGLKVKVNVVLQKGINDHEWPEFAELTRKIPVDVRFIEMMPIGYGKDYQTIYNEDILLEMEKIYPGLYEDDSVHGNGPAMYYKIPDAKGSIGFISAMHGKFCGHCNRIRLTSQGKIKPCLCFGDSVDVRDILQEYEYDTAEEKVREAIALAICKKPENHKFEVIQEVTEQRQMVQIGG